MPICQFCDENIPAGVTKCPTCGAEVPAEVRRTESNELEGELLALIDRGGSMEAIKRYREATGAGLAQSHQAIETLIATRSLPAEAESQPHVEGSDLERDTLHLLKEESKIAAIKLYRERTGVGLKQAKEAVESLAAKHGLAAKGPGCFAVLVGLASTAALTSLLLM